MIKFDQLSSNLDALFTVYDIAFKLVTEARWKYDDQVFRIEGLAVPVAHAASFHPRL